MLFVLLIPSLIVILLYIGKLSWYSVSFHLHRSNDLLKGERIRVKITVVIPVRNEAEQIPFICNDLAGQERVDPDYEVVFVDDHSTDRSATALEKFCAMHARYKLIRLPEGVAGKKQAIAAGVAAASGEWILQTDADCRLPAGFIASHAGHAARGADLVAGPVLVDPGERWWSRFEALDHFSLIATGMAAAAAGRPVMCSGANLAYSKRTFLASAEKLLAVPHVSGDDVFLLAEAKKAHRRIVFPDGPEIVVTTSPTTGPAAFLQQRIRWGSKAKYYRDPELVSLSLLVWLANTVLAGLLVASLFIKGMLWIFLAALFLKSLSEYLLLNGVADRLGKKPLLRIFPAAVLFYYFYIAMAGLLAMAGTFTWKGRRHGES